MAKRSTLDAKPWLPRLLTHAALFVVQVAFASQAVEGKIAMMPRAAGGEAISPAALAMARMIAAAIFFQVFSRATGRLSPTTRADQRELVGLSLLGISINQGLFLLGLRSTSPISAALLSIAIPVFTAALAVASGHERASLPLGAGLLLCVGGVLSLTGVRSLDVGAAIVAVNSLCYSGYIVRARSTIARLGPLTVITWAFTWGALSFAVVGLVPLGHAIPELTPRGWGYLAFIVAMPTIVAYLFNAWALGRSSASLVTVYIFLQPLLAAALAHVQLGATFDRRLAFAAALIVSGVVTVAARRAPGRAVPAPR